MKFNYFENEKYKTIRDWELETGIKIVKLRGFKGRKSSAYNKKISEIIFRKLLKRSIITVKTQKGLEFLYA